MLIIEPCAEKKKWETTTIGLPQISATVDYQNWIKQQVSLIPAEFFGGNEGEFAEVEFGTKHSLNATATLRQLIFDGSYLVGLQSAKASPISINVLFLFALIPFCKPPFLPNSCAFLVARATSGNLSFLPDLSNTA